jgi:hypothetical protein
VEKLRKALEKKVRRNCRWRSQSVEGVNFFCGIIKCVFRDWKISTTSRIISADLILKLGHRISEELIRGEKKIIFVCFAVILTLQDGGFALTKKEEVPAQLNGKKPYQKPAFQVERVFETNALSCGKLTGGGNQCVTMRKAS